MESKICQSCGMQLGDPGFYGTNEDESRNEEYCIYCFAGGEFNDELTMDEMIESCAELLSMNTGDDDSSVEAAIIRMKEQFPTLKRWTTA